MNSAQPLHLPTAPLSGTCLVEAGAGTGKTYAMAGLYLRLLLESELPVASVLVVTFTIAATAELRGRIRARVRQAHKAFGKGSAPDGDELLDELIKRIPRQKALDLLGRALAEFDQAAIFTIHGFCRRVLAAAAFETRAPFGLDLATDQSGYIQESVADWWRLKVLARSGLFFQFVLSQKVRIETFTVLADLACKHPDLRMEAGQTAETDLSLLEETARNTYAQARKLWIESGEETLERLDLNALSGRGYRADWLEGWINKLGELFEARTCPLDCFGQFHKFTPSTIKQHTKKGHKPPTHPFFDACGKWDEARSNLVAAYDALLNAIKRAFLNGARKDLSRRKQEDGVQGFDELVTRLRDGLAGEGFEAAAQVVRAQYRAALIDEFQDTDPVQFAIFERLFHTGDTPLFLIGDPKQAIYSFRGADVFAYIRAKGIAGHFFTLAHNWRSEPGLVRAVNKLFASCPNPFVLDGIGFAPAKSPDRQWPRLKVAGEPEHLHLWHVPESEEGPFGKDDLSRIAARAVADEAARLLRLAAKRLATLDGKPLKPGDMAVLVRAHKEGDMVQEALRALGIPSVRVATDTVFGAPEASDVLKALRAMAAPSDERTVRTALSTALLGLDAEALDRLAGDEAAWEQWVGRFSEWRDVWAGRGVMPALNALMRGAGTRRRVLALPDGERRMTNFLHLMEALHQREAEAGLGMRGVAAWLAGRMAGDGSASEAYELRLESDADAVQVVTIHKSKGLQYPVVFCPFLHQGVWNPPGSPLLFHDPKGDHAMRLEFAGQASDTGKGLNNLEILAENMRLGYVALTRARNRCYTAFGHSGNAGTSAMGHLRLAGELEDPPDGEALANALNALWKKTDSDGVLRWLQGLGEHPDIRLRDLPEEEEPLPRALAYGGPDPEALKERVPNHTLPPPLRTTSFTGLSRGLQAWHPLRQNHPGETPDAASLLPAGPAAGTMMHKVFELTDFTLPGTDHITDLCRNVLPRHGFDSGLAPDLAALVRDVLDAEIAPGLRLREVPRSDRLDEMAFHLPLAGLAPSALARHYRDNACPGLPEDFADRLESLDFRAMSGFVTGFMDLVFRHQGTFYVLDWKSNHLGPNLAFYGSENVDEAMSAHGYHLQYHLYLAALHRYLGTRLKGYDYDRHLGGALYVFLRGVSPDMPVGHGVHSARPPGSFVQGLGDFLGRGAS